MVTIMEGDVLQHDQPRYCELDNCPRTPEMEALSRKADKSDLYKTLLSFCLGIVVALAGVWATAVRDSVSRTEVESMIATHPAVVGMTEKVTAISDLQKEQVRRLQRVNDALTSVAIKVGAPLPEERN